MTDLLQTVAAQAAVAIGPIVTALVGLLAVYLTRLINQRIANERARDAVSRVGLAASAAVTQIEQTLVRQLKAKSADGKLSAVEAKAAAKAAFDQTMILLGESGVKIVDTGLDDLEAWIVSLIEVKVAAMKGK
jgi:hypothetical protein